MVVHKAADDADARQDAPFPRPAGLSARDAFIADTLDWCSEVFRSNRARFISPTGAGSWIVYTRRDGTLTTHQADYAEAAMARTVGLARHPLVVSRPRVTRPGTTDLRPISVHGYLGIPLICQDRLAGVIECAGEVRPDMEAALLSALPRLEQAGARLLYDPALAERPSVTPETTCDLSSGVWSTGGIDIAPEELAFLAAISGPTTIAAAAEAASLDPITALTLAESLLQRGLLEIHDAR